MLDTVLPAAVVTIHKDLCEKTTALSPYFHQKCALLRDLLLVSCERVCGYQFFHSERTFSRMQTSKPPWQMSQKVLARRMYEGLKWDCLCRWERIGTSSLLSSFENKSLFRYTLAYIGIWIRKSLGREGQWGVEPLISPDEKTSQLWWQYIKFQTWALITSGNNLESFYILLIISDKATSFQWCWTERKVK